MLAIWKLYGQHIERKRVEGASLGYVVTRDTPASSLELHTFIHHTLYF